MPPELDESPEGQEGQATGGDAAGIWSLANTLTTARIVLIPFFAALILYHRVEWALLIFVTAALTDLLDGYVARVQNRQTSLGRILDPVADKFMLSTSFVLFAVQGWVPLWLTITVLSRDIIVVIGILLVRLMSGELVVRPTSTGKTTVAVQMVYIGYVLAAQAWTYGALPGIDAFSLVVVALTVGSGVQYMLQGLKIAGDT